MLEKAPNSEELITLIGMSLFEVWTKLCDRIEERYDMEHLWNSGGKVWKYEYKYRCGGKTLCSLYAKNHCIGFMIIFGKAEREKFEHNRQNYTETVQKIYDEAKTYHDGKWVMFLPEDTSMFEDFIHLLEIKRKPNRKRNKNLDVANPITDAENHDGVKMELHYKNAEKTDADLLIGLYNQSFYSDYIRYGTCPGYGRTKESMENSISKYAKEIILCNGLPVGVISVQSKGAGIYYISCLCVIPKYQNRGIGTQAISHVKRKFQDWKRIQLVTPADKEENLYFYTQKCGFKITNTQMDGAVKVVTLSLER